MAQGALIAVRKPPLLSVDVSELLRRPGASKDVRFDHELEGISLPLARVRPGEVFAFDLTFDALVDGIHVSGDIDGDVELECRRCLRDVHKHIRLAVDDVFLYPGEGDDDGDVYRIEGEHVDLEPLVRDTIVLELPLNPLCRDDCRGLCATCGADRNEVDCGHSQEPVDIRWSALDKLRSLEE